MFEDELPDVYYGEATEDPMDFRTQQNLFDDLDDDSELHPTPSGVVEMLGFDPLEFGVVKKSNPFHDKSGLFTSKDKAVEGDSIETFHGTSIENAEKIMKEGLKPFGGASWVSEDIGRSFTYARVVTTEWAIDHKISPDKVDDLNVAIVVVKVPKEKSGEGVISFEKGVPKEQIKEVRLYKYKDTKENHPVPVQILKESLFYVVVPPVMLYEEGSV